MNTTPKICPLLAIAAVAAAVKPTIEATACLGLDCQWAVRRTNYDGTTSFRACAVQFIGVRNAP